MRDSIPSDEYYPDVGIYKLQLLRRLEKAYSKLDRTFDPFEFAKCSRKELSLIISKTNADLHNLQKEKQRGTIS